MNDIETMDDAVTRLRCLMLLLEAIIEKPEVKPHGAVLYLVDELEEVVDRISELHRS